MCGRYTFHAAPEHIQQEFGLPDPPEIAPRYNIAPQQTLPIITNAEPTTLTPARWGLVPHWAKDASIGNKLFNARSETAHEKPSFKQAFSQRPCLVPANGFFEWLKEGQARRPMYIHLKERPLFAFAGLWESWQNPNGREVRTFTVLTTAPNALIQPLHHRMAVILERDAYTTWLGLDDAPLEVRQALLRPYPSDKMTYYEVAPLVNKVGHDTPDMIRPYQAPQQPRLF